MRIAGAIIALIAGIFGTLAAGITLVVGGMGSALGSSGSTTVIALGWGGVFFSFATIVLGAVAIGVKSSRIPGILLIVSALLGAVLGGTLVAVFMVLALVGGVLAVFGVKKPIAVPASPYIAPAGPVPPPPPVSMNPVPPPPPAPEQSGGPA